MRVFIGINLGKLQEDVKSVCRATGVVMSRQLIINGLNDSVLSNSRYNYDKHVNEIKSIYNTSGIIDIGRIDENRYLDVLKVFNLKDKYRLPMCSNENDYVPTPNNNASNDAVVNQLAEIKSELKDINSAIDNLAYVLLQIVERCLLELSQ